MGTMSKEEILKILEDAKDKNSDVPMRLVRQAFEKLPEPCEDAVSRQAAIDALDEIESEVADGYGFQYEKWRKHFTDLPSAQPEIIRCKDCKYSEHWYRDKRRCFLWHETGIDVFDDGFCNYAKRRTDE